MWWLMFAIVLACSGPPDVSLIPRLRDAQMTGDHEIVFVREPYAAAITYHPGGQFFLLDSGQIQKFDRRGRQVAVVEPAPVRERIPDSAFVVERKR